MRKDDPLPRMRMRTDLRARVRAHAVRKNVRARSCVRGVRAPGRALPGNAPSPRASRRH